MKEKKERKAQAVGNVNAGGPPVAPKGWHKNAKTGKYTDGSGAIRSPQEAKAAREDGRED
jgi:hypothetical protein